MTWGCSCPQCGCDDCPNFGRCGGSREVSGFILGMRWQGWAAILILFAGLAFVRFG